VSQKEELFQAIGKGDLPVVKAIIESDPQLAASRNEKGQSAVLLAVYSGQRNVLDFLLSQNLTLELHEAAATGQLAHVKQTVERSPELASSFSPDGFPIAALAAFLGHRDVTEYLISKGADVNAVSTNGSGYTALTGAVASGQTNIVAYLLQHAAEVNYRYGPGYSPLLTAAANGHLEIVKLLLAHGADAHARTNDHQDALSLAVARNHKELAEYLKS